MVQAGPVRYVVDGMNVIGSSPDGWWRDRPGARRRLVADLATLAGPHSEVTVVFDGRPQAGEPEAAARAGIEVRFAPGGPNAADRAIVDLLDTLDDASEVTVVTSDAALAQAVRVSGARVEGVRAFRDRLPRQPSDPGGPAGQRPRSMPPLFRLGLLVPGRAPSAPADRSPFEQLVDVASTAEASGFDSLWVLDAPGAVALGAGPPDRVIDPRSAPRPLFEAYTVLGALAARTRRARLGALGGSLDWRGPGVLVKQVTAVDVLSGGRALLGIGAPPWTAASAAQPREVGRAERHDRLEEGLVACRTLFSAAGGGGPEAGGAHMAGRYYRLAGAVNRPPPRQAGGVPVVLTGAGEGVLDLVARYADACVFAGDAAHAQRTIHALARQCDDVGRDPATVTTVHFGALVIAGSDDELGAGIDRAGREMGGGDRWRQGAVVGRPDEVARQMGSLLDAGVDGFLVHMPGAGPEAVALAGATLGTVLGGDRGP
jgi:alkanesulfonate monooxygenase SsuD/methylene tetrahydromethanopterin reductase-like flavin-dependent oxidoreductase (luciferase family)/predicted RNA-binding protein with PIN domain